MNPEALELSQLSVGPLHFYAGEIDVLYSGTAIAVGLWVETDNENYLWDRVSWSFGEERGSPEANHLLDQALIVMNWDCVADATGYFQQVKRSPQDPDNKK